MSEATHRRIRTGFRWAGRIIGFAMFIFFVALIIGGISMHNTHSIEFDIMIGITFVTFFALIISWWKGFIASILIFLSSVGLGFLTFYSHHLLMWMIIGLYLLAGILIFSSWWLSKDKRP
jgi:hypothetical protein